MGGRGRGRLGRADHGMKLWGLWKPLALRRIRPITELLASAIPLVNPYSMVASIESR